MKDPLEYLNDVKIDLSEYEEVELNDIEKKKIKKLVRKTIAKGNKYSKFSTKISGLIAGLTICILTLGVYFPTYAQKIPILKDVYERIFSSSDLGNYEDNSVPVMAKIKVGEYEVNIEKAYYNGIELTIIFNIIGDKPIINDSRFSLETSITTEDNIVENSGLFYGEFIDDYTFQAIQSVQFKAIDGGELPTVFNGNLKVTKLYTGRSDQEYIDINIEPIPLTLDSSTVAVKDYEINKTIISRDRTIEVLNAKEYDTGIFIKFKYPEGQFALFRDYFIWDSNKGILQEKTISPNREESISIMQHNPPSEDGEVYLIPYQYDTSGDRRRVLIPLEKGKFDFGSQGSLEILDITDVLDTTEIRVRATGNYAAYPLSFEGDSGIDHYNPINSDDYHPIFKKDEKNLGVLDTEKTFVFKKLDRNKNYYIYERLDNYEILYQKMIKIK
ncbi:MAG: hypothetical protein MR510_06550 [Clostridium sp.]|nr:hypothetical protein [Clostridium sp.]